MPATVSVISMAALAMAATVPRSGDIVGGQDADIYDFPYQISLQENGAHSCGGSIISPTHIVTAAHCVYDQIPNNLTVRAGSTFNNEGGQLVYVSDFVYHPSYDPSTTDYDIAVLTLAKELNFGSDVAPIELADDGPPPREGTQCVVSGWGATSEGGQGSVVLQSLNEPVVDRERCERNYLDAGYIFTDSMFCAGFWEEGRDSCQGDSGGPLVDTTSGRLVGIVSWGLGCARADYPGVYASVSVLRDFIANNTGI